MLVGNGDVAPYLVVMRNVDDPSRPLLPEIMMGTGVIHRTTPLATSETPRLSFFLCFFFSFHEQISTGFNGFKCFIW